MIYLYSGTPGSGKSYHAAADIYYRLRRSKKTNRYRVIANFPVAMDSPYFRYVDNSQLTDRYLMNYARIHHVPGIEGQTLVVIDEAQIIFNSRSWQSDGTSRMDWIKFFTQHRKLGFDFILIAQNDRMIDRQIRCLIEYEISHMKMSNFFRILPITVFLAVNHWYGQKMKLNHEMIFYRKKIAALYDTYMTFSGSQTRCRRRRLSAGTQRRPIPADRGKGFPARIGRRSKPSASRSPVVYGRQVGSLSG